MDIARQLAGELGLKPEQVERTVALLDEGNTVPFIARYRKEVTGGIDDATLRDLQERLTYLRHVQARRDEIARLLAEQGVLTEELSAAIAAAGTLVELEDIYRPYRPKRKTRASVAREKGLGPLAEALLDLRDGSPEGLAAGYINEELGVATVEEALQGAMDIIAEMVADNAEYRGVARNLTRTRGLVVSRGKKEGRSPYEMYYEFQEPVARILPHRVLALNRGEKEEWLAVKVEAPEEQILAYLKGKVVRQGPAATLVEEAVADGYRRLMAPSIEREVRQELTDRAEEQAIKVFAVNLNQLLLTPPCRGYRVLGVDPAYRTGCKLAVVDETGKVLETGVIYPTPPQNQVEQAKAVVKKLVDRHGVRVIAIGNGTASRETERFIAQLIKEVEAPLVYTIVNEAGASVYSASSLGSEEFPDLDVSLRSAVSIARRLLDPLAELVKIDPKSIGVGQYQHDVNQKRLAETLAGVVEDSVNRVGVDLNTASWALLSYVAGLNTTQAKNLVRYREANGSFQSRQDLLAVPRLGEKTFTQCAGFLRIPGAANILDNTGVHPESYEVTYRLLAALGATPADFAAGKYRDLPVREWAERLGVGVPTLRDIVKELERPGRDPREELPPPVFQEDVLELEDLKPGMVLTGVVRNVVDFGAFVDIGVHQDGLVHISELSNTFVRNPLEAVKVGDNVRVKVLEVDPERRRISLSIKQAMH